MSGATAISTYRPVRRSSERNKQTGVSLIELMISMVVGLILIAAVFNMYTGTVRSSRFTEGVQFIQENGNYAVTVLQKGLRLAGYSPVPGVDGELQALDMSNSSASRLTVRSRQAFDCNGLDTSATDGVAVNTYSLNSATRELTCRGNQTGSTDMAVVEGIEQFQVLYGIDDDGDASSCEPQRYIPYNANIQSAEVVALRFAILVNSGRPIRTRSAADTYVLLNQEVSSASDRFVREVFSGTVLLRNNILCSGI